MNLINPNEFISQLGSFVNSKIPQIGMDLYQVVSYDENGKLKIRKYYQKTNDFEVLETGYGLGNSKGIFTKYSPGDLLICATIYGQLYVITSLFNEFNAVSKQTKLIVDEGEFVIQSTNGAKIKLLNDGSFKLFNKDNYGIECDSNGNVTIRGTTITNTQTPGSW